MQGGDVFGVGRRQEKDDEPLEEGRLEEALALYDGAFVVRTAPPVIDLREGPRRERPLRVARQVPSEA